jgi:hypothetical protein
LHTHSMLAGVEFQYLHTSMYFDAMDQAAPAFQIDLHSVDILAACALWAHARLSSPAPIRCDRDVNEDAYLSPSVSRVTGRSHRVVLYARRENGSSDPRQNERHRTISLGTRAPLIGLRDLVPGGAPLRHAA